MRASKRSLGLAIGLVLTTACASTSPSPALSTDRPAAPSSPTQATPAPAPAAATTTAVATVATTAPARASPTASLVAAATAAPTAAVTLTAAPATTAAATTAAPTPAPPIATPAATAAPTSAPATPTASPGPAAHVPLVLKSTPAPCVKGAADPATTGADGFVYWGASPVVGLTVELRDNVLGFGQGTLRGSATTDASGYFRVTGAPTTDAKIEVIGSTAYDLPIGAGGFFCAAQIARVSGGIYGSTDQLQIVKKMGLSVGEQATVPAGMLTITWPAVGQELWYCASLYDITASTTLTAGTCRAFQSPATEVPGRAYTTPALVSGHQYRFEATSGYANGASIPVAVGRGTARITVP